MAFGPPLFGRLDSGDRREFPGGDFLGTDVIAIDAPAEEHDAILLDRVAGWAAVGRVSFLRVNKPVWRLEVIRYAAGSLGPYAADAVADSALVLRLLAQEKDGLLPGSRRELVFRAMRRIADGLSLTRKERLRLHRGGYGWAVDLGRWDAVGIAALEARFTTLRDGMTARLTTPCDPESETRWRLLRRSPASSAAAVDQARTTIANHANRLGVFAEAEAILHYFLFRLDTARDQA